MRSNRLDSIRFTVHGTPEPGGSKRAFVVNGSARVVDANPRAKDWKQRVAQVAGEHYSGPLLRGPLEVTMTFVQPRPKGHYGTGRNSARLKPSAPSHPTTRPDVLKLARATEDSLTGVVWADDAQIVDEHLLKVYGDSACCEITVSEIKSESDWPTAREEAA